MSEPADPAPAPEASYSASHGLAARLARAGMSLLFTSYQSGRLYLVGVKPDGGLNVHHTALAKPMGLRRDGAGGFAMTAGFHVLRFANALAPGQAANGIFDACYVPRRVHVTGELDAHDVGVDADGRVIFVNTRFNCLAALSDRHSFTPVWRPSFVSALVDEDRCHLNGLAMADGAPAFVTAASRSDTIDGWRDRRADGGVAISVATGEIACEGLSMPHSPRVHEGRLWLLNSGAGELGRVEDGRFHPVAFVPGFARGLTFHGRFAFVGLSKPRYARFEGLALDRRLRESDSTPWCGVQVIDADTGVCVDWFRIDGTVDELYDVEVAPGALCPMAVAPMSPEAAQLIALPPA
ncbi:TIGR03032 family protein [Albimonas sp. CAU 1670]|uniref:TIGR03032 family protein n=1 Tax=Albimonas sp. CAU 1670 TaxID=3032599 RepID=UPI0023DA54D2|nr:TIGR03032 family protein [Albimonas sp. CAU 1670]MDF2234823.1 TIGR03032 family protein [Albimonas sp. CAU 1670]